MPRVLICLMLGWLAVPAFGGGRVEEPVISWTLRAGSFNTEDDLPVAFEAGFEVALPARRFRWLPEWVQLRPIVGLAGNDREGFWGHEGIRWDFRVHGRWWLQPSFSVVFYEKGKGKDLGSTVHFRSAFEVAYELANGRRIGLGVYHLSNANLYPRNPGEESVVLSYTWHSHTSD
ncbi:MAG TPA: acyloxyacyl hydrolase [Thermoanaerobaculia bacterium]|nr:acyloxyacyl hydrolase [Thermoanaerobaculia bacterium]